MGEGRGLAAAKEARFVAIPGDGAGGEGGVAIFEALHASTDVKAYYNRAPVFCLGDMATNATGDVVTLTVPVGPQTVVADGVPVMRNGDRCEIRYADGRVVPGVLAIDLVQQEVLDVCNRSFDLTAEGLLAESRSLSRDPANVRNATAYNNALDRARGSLDRVRRMGARADAVLQASDRLHDAAQVGIAGVGIVGGVLVGTNPVGILLLAVGGGLAERVNNATRIPIPGDENDGAGDGFLPGGDEPESQNLVLTAIEEGAGLFGAPGRIVGAGVSAVGAVDDIVEAGGGFPNRVPASVVSGAAPVVSRVPSQTVGTWGDGTVFNTQHLTASQRDLRALANQARDARERLDAIADPYADLDRTGPLTDDERKARAQLEALGDEGLDPRKELEALERAATEAADAAAALLAAQRRQEGVVVRLQNAERARYQCQFEATPAAAEAMGADAFLWRPGDP